MQYAAILVTLGYLPADVVTTLATRIQSSWSRRSYIPCVSEVHCAASLVASGYLPEDVMTTLATKIKSLWSHGSYCPDVVEVQCAAALAATGHLISVKYMVLSNLQLPSSEDMLSLASRVSGRVVLNTVSGDIAPLFSSLSCRWLLIYNMELDQAATSSLVRALQHGVEKLGLYGRVRLHIQTLLEYDGRGRCGDVRGWSDRDTYKEEMKTWAHRVNWIVSEASGNIIMKRK